MATTATVSVEEYLEDEKYKHNRMGIQNVWVIDSETRTGQTRQGAEQTPTMRFAVAGSPIYLDVAQLFDRFDEENQPLAE